MNAPGREQSKRDFIGQHSLVMSACCLVAVAKERLRGSAISKGDFLDSEDGLDSRGQIKIAVAVQPTCLVDHGLPGGRCSGGQRGDGGSRETLQSCCLNFSEGLSRRKRHAQRASGLGQRKSRCGSRRED